MKKITVLCLALVIVLGATGATFALWSKTLYIDATVNTGEVDAEFDRAFTDDDYVVNDPDRDLTDPVTGEDPDASGKNVDRKDKDVGNCWAVIDPNDAQVVHITINNGYPCYYCTAFFDIVNTGSVPVKVNKLSLIGVPSEVTVEWTQIEEGMQLDPAGMGPGPWVLEGDLDMHVEQIAAENATYTFSAEIELVQWNEYPYPPTP